MISFHGMLWYDADINFTYTDLYHNVIPVPPYRLVNNYGKSDWRGYICNKILNYLKK